MSRVKIKRGYRPRRQTNAQWTECSCGKRGFSSRSAGKRALAGAGNKVRLYVCPFSGKWHVTSTDMEELES
jgi:hypothetical protein